MEIWVESRTKMEDYTWRTCAKCSQSAPPHSVTEGYDQWGFEDCVPWFGLVSNQKEATLFFGNLITNREDSRGRPIFVHAALQAENSKDVLDLVGFVASLLVREGELLPKWTAFFSEVFDNGVVGTLPDTSHLIRTESSQESIGRFVYPREDALARDSIAKRLCAGVNLSVPLAVGTTGRSGKGIFERVCRSGNMWQTAFFSSSCSMKAELQVAVEPTQEKKPNTRAIAAAIGGAVLLVLFAAVIGTCSRGSRKDGGASMSTNRQVLDGIVSSPGQIVDVNALNESMRSALHVTYARLKASLPDIGPLESCSLVNKDGVLICKFGESAAIVGEGHEIMVQRFENGVINCRSDGKNDVQWLSWHDWWAISKPGCHKDIAP